MGKKIDTTDSRSTIVGFVLANSGCLKDGSAFLQIANEAGNYAGQVAMISLSKKKNPGLAKMLADLPVGTPVIASYKLDVVTDPNPTSTRKAVIRTGTQIFRLAETADVEAIRAAIDPTNSHAAREFLEMARLRAA